MSIKKLPNDIYSLQEVAKMLRVSERSIFRYMEAGRLKATKIGYWRFTKNDLLSFLAENANVREALWLKENADFIKPEKKNKK